MIHSHFPTCSALLRSALLSARLNSKYLIQLRVVKRTRGHIIPYVYVVPPSVRPSVRASMSIRSSRPISLYVYLATSLPSFLPSPSCFLYEDVNSTADWVLCPVSNPVTFLLLYKNGRGAAASLPPPQTDPCMRSRPFGRLADVRNGPKNL